MDYDHQAALEAAKKELEINDVISAEETQENKENTVELSTGETITFDFDSLTGKRILTLKNEFKRKNKDKAIMIDELDDGYCTFIASKICNKSFEEIENLKYKDWAKVKNFVKDYLLGD